MERARFPRRAAAVAATFLCGSLQAQQASTPVGQAPDRADRPPEIPALVDMRGVLTPRAARGSSSLRCSIRIRPTTASRSGRLSLLRRGPALQGAHGKDPFEVPVDPATNLQTKLPTGSGFIGLRPSLLAILPSDPAVFFGSVSYLWNVKRDVGNGFGKVDPGDALGVSFGMGLALNERASFSVGYDHNAVFKTKQNGAVIANSATTQLGLLLLGTSYRIAKDKTLNLTLGVGVTEEAPDVQITLRLPIAF